MQREVFRYMDRANQMLNNEKQKLIPRSILAAALLLIEWVQEQPQMRESSDLQCQQAAVSDHHEETKPDSR